MRTIPLSSCARDQLLEDLKKYRMTFIITGVSKNRPFLMVDCVGSETVNGVKRFKYMNKLSKLISTKNETYFCLTGSDSYGYAMSCLDRELYEKGQCFDFTDETHIARLLVVFNDIKEHRSDNGYEVNNFARLYFVNNNGVYYYEIGSDGVLASIQSISDGCFILPHYSNLSPRELKETFESNDQLISFCKEKINKAQTYGINLKDKFSYIIFDEDGTVFNNSISNDKELVYALTGENYDKIENPTANNA